MHIGNPAYSVLCHGVRRGEAVRHLSHANIEDILGNYLYVLPDADSGIVRCDVSQPHKTFHSRFDVVYRNSTDHAKNPVKTLLLRAAQLNNKWASPIILESDAGRGSCGLRDLDVSDLGLHRFPFYLSIESEWTLSCDRIVKSNSFPTRYFARSSRGIGCVDQ